ncbi:MAG: hypothetical protein O2946_10805 [Planctomycetota bacterium]|nr:hypothetical protein [Planctomycetota bacterium]MDA0969189.1 hypothetical protein [Planctomycetota bacterium]
MATGFAAGGGFPYSPPAMDYRIHKPQPRCASTDRPLTAGEPFYSALVRQNGGIIRLDLAADAWQGPPESSLAWWRSTMPAENAKPTLAPVDALLDLLEQLEGNQTDAALRYLLALVLVRRRVLKIIDASEVDEAGTASSPAEAGVLDLNCRRRGTDYQIPITPPSRDETTGLEERLTALLWAGEAA